MNIRYPVRKADGLEYKNYDELLTDMRKKRPRLVVTWRKSLLARGDSRRDVIVSGLGVGSGFT